MSHKKTQNYFDHVAETYEAKCNSGLWGWHKDKEFQAVVSMLPITKKNKHLIDLGCGSGYYIRRLNQLGYSKILGVDSSPKMIGELKAESAEVVVENIEDFISTRPTDTVICAGALEFVENPQKVFNNVAKMLNNRGQFILLSPKRNIFGWFYSFFHLLHGVRALRFRKSDLASMAKKSGLSFEKSKTIFPFSQVSCFQKNTDENRENNV